MKFYLHSWNSFFTANSSLNGQNHLGIAKLDKVLYRQSTMSGDLKDNIIRSVISELFYY